MKKIGFLLAALAAAVVMTGGIAEAAPKKRAKVVVTPAPAYGAWWWGSWGVRDPRLEASNTVVGVGSAVGYYGLKDVTRTRSSLYGSTGAYVATSAGCAVVSPIIGTIVTQRELTQREVFVSTANCFAPIVGGWAMNYWFDYYGWDRPKAKKRG